MKTRANILAMFFVALVMASTATGEIIYVDADATGANYGLSWADAFNDLQDALTVAQAGDEIRVAQGIYKPDQGVGRTATFQLKNGVVIQGGYAGFGELDPNARDIALYETILSGDLNGDDVDVNDPRVLLDEPSRSENSYHIVTGSDTDETAMLDGFTVTGGNANYKRDGWPNNAGGGIFNNRGNPTLNNCTFAANSAYVCGGGCNDNSNPTLTDCTISGNSADYYGGGMCNWRNSSPTLINCKFSENSAVYNGGGMYNVEGNPTLINCVFIGNSAGKGGGMHNLDNSSPTLTNCLFSRNSASAGGGMISGGYHGACNPQLFNCVFSGNSAYDVGGGIYNYGCYLPTSTTLTNCTFAGNLAPNGSALACNSGLPLYPSTLKMTNCILWDGGDEIWNDDDSTISITYSDVESGWPGEGNIDADPCFVETGYWILRDDPNIVVEPNDPNAVWIEGDYHLLPDSPCIDAGDPNYAAELNETDLDGKPRVMGVRIDMGVYEYGQLVPSEVRIIPRTINLASKGKWIAAFLWPPEGFNIADTDCISLLLEYEIEPEQLWVDEEKQVVTARFSREEVQSILDVGEVELIITGHLIDGTVFKGRDVVRVIPKASGKLDKYVQASNPNPADGATGVDINADLSWTAGSGATSHDVYFGMSNPPPFVCNQTSTTFDPGTMAYNTTYFWRIDEVNKWGVSSGEVWSFTTEEEGGGKPPGAPPGCFPADTPVWIDGAQVQFSKVAAGQKVGRLDATDAESCFEKPVCLKEIESILEYQGTYDYYNIVLETGNRINVVHSHYFLTASDRWVLVENLKVGSKLQSLNGPISIKTITKRDVPFTGRLYDLKIKGGDRYFVGKDGVAVRGH